MNVVWALLVGIIIGLTLMGIFGLGFLVGPSVNPISAYCRGFTEGFSYAFLQNAPTGALSQGETDRNEQWCVLEQPFSGEDWLWHGPLIPS